MFQFAVLYTASLSTQEKRREKEPLSESSKQWLEEVVPYIITKAEKEVFLSLPNEVERGRFINLFWKKRDPNPATPQNEYKDEYYRRIVLANKYFSYSSVPGWRTDRGRIFILLGPPQEIERNFNVTESTGINYAAREIWQYWGLPNPNLPYNFQLTFVDKTGAGYYELIRDYLSEKALTSLNDMTLQFDAMNNLIETEKNPFENLDKIKPTVETVANYNLIPFEITTYLFY
ncbi:MAG: GWxTD domain-containing protein, partial [Candidatus Aminicenantes bacterium]|nr:GWxTD domain-containing protein [Candidatus Aminicenantes bacterium]